MAGASFHAAIRIGKFQGMICATTPIGSKKWYETRSLVSFLIVPSCVRIAAAK